MWQKIINLCRCDNNFFLKRKSLIFYPQIDIERKSIINERNIEIHIDIPAHIWESFIVCSSMKSFADSNLKPAEKLSLLEFNKD